MPKRAHDARNAAPLLDITASFQRVSTFSLVKVEVLQGYNAS